MSSSLKELSKELVSWLTKINWNAESDGDNPLQATSISPVSFLSFPESIKISLENYFQKHDIDDPSDNECSKLNDELIFIQKKLMESETALIAHIGLVLSPTDSNTTFFYNFEYPLLEILMVLYPFYVSSKGIKYWTDRYKRLALDSAGISNTLVSASRKFLNTILTDLQPYKNEEIQLYINQMKQDIISDLILISIKDRSLLGEWEDHLVYEERTRFILQNTRSVLEEVIQRDAKLFFKVINESFVRSESRLQSLNLLSSMISKQSHYLFGILETPLFENLLDCLLKDTSSSAISIACSILIMLLPYVCDKLTIDIHLPKLLMIFTRLLCWNKTFPVKKLKPPRGINIDMTKNDSNEDVDTTKLGSVSLSLKNSVIIDQGWKNYSSEFDFLASEPTEHTRLFTFLYGLFPLTIVEYVRNPTLILLMFNPISNQANDLSFTTEIKQKSSKILQRHLLTVDLLGKNAKEEQEDTLRWKSYDSPQAIGAMCLRLDEITSTYNPVRKVGSQDYYNDNSSRKISEAAIDNETAYSTPTTYNHNDSDVLENEHLNDKEIPHNRARENVKMTASTGYSRNISNSRTRSSRRKSSVTIASGGFTPKFTFLTDDYPMQDPETSVLLDQFHENRRCTSSSPAPVTKTRKRSSTVTSVASSTSTSVTNSNDGMSNILFSHRYLITNSSRSTSNTKRTSLPKLQTLRLNPPDHDELNSNNIDIRSAGSNYEESCIVSPVNIQNQDTPATFATINTIPEVKTSSLNTYNDKSTFISDATSPSYDPYYLNLKVHQHELYLVKSELNFMKYIQLLHKVNYKAYKSVVKNKEVASSSIKNLQITNDRLQERIETLESLIDDIKIALDAQKKYRSTNENKLYLENTEIKRDIENMKNLLLATEDNKKTTDENLKNCFEDLKNTISKKENLKMRIILKNNEYQNLTINKSIPIDTDTRVIGENANPMNHNSENQEKLETSIEMELNISEIKNEIINTTEKRSQLIEDLKQQNTNLNLRLQIAKDNLQEPQILNRDSLKEYIDSMEKKILELDDHITFLESSIKKKDQQIKANKLIINKETHK